MGFLRWPTIGHRSRSGQVDRYPFDLDASERITRPKTGYDYWPMHDNRGNFAKIGSMTPLLAMQDNAVWNGMWGHDPYGPIVSALPVNLQYQITIPGLNKQMPTG